MCFNVFECLLCFADNHAHTLIVHHDVLGLVFTHTLFLLHTCGSRHIIEALGENSLVPPIVAANVPLTNSEIKATLSTQQLVSLQLDWDFPLCGALG